MKAFAATKSLCALLSFLVVAFASEAARAADDVTYGDKPTFQSGDNFSLDISPDKKALTITFNGLEVTADTGKVPDPAARRTPAAKASNAPVATRAFSLVLPITAGKSIRTSYFASGFVVTNAGSEATLLFSVNGKNTVVKFPPKSDKSFVQKLDIKTAYASEIRMTVFLLAERDSTNPQTAAFLGVNAIDNDLAVANKKKAAGKPKS
jgi:hypothetical protein